jgi:hypothetical protein
MGQKIIGSGRTQALGKGIALTANGMSIAIGAPNYNQKGKMEVGQVRVFDFRDSLWIQVSTSIEGELELDRLGKDVAISQNGKVVTIGDDQLKYAKHSGKLDQAIVLDANAPNYAPNQIYYQPVVLWSQDGVHCNLSEAFERFNYTLFKEEEKIAHYSIPKGQTIKAILDRDYTIQVDSIPGFSRHPYVRKLEYKELANRIVDTSLRDTFCLIPNIQTDLRTTIVPLYKQNSLSELSFKIMVENLSADPTPCQLEFLYQGEQVRVAHASLGFTRSEANKVFWDDGVIAPFEQRSFLLQLEVEGSAQSIQLKAKAINTFKEINPEDNVFQLNYKTMTSYPSSFLIHVRGDSLSTGEMKAKPQHYQLCFQMPESSDTKVFMIRNIIDEHFFDASSIRFIDSNAPLIVRVEDNILEIKGQFTKELKKEAAVYIQYAIRTQADLTSKAKTLRQDASIYFDQQAPMRVSSKVLVVQSAE